MATVSAPDRQSPSPSYEAIEADRRRRAKAGREIIRVFRPIVLAHDEANGDGAEPDSNPVARLANDLILTALAQTAAHRLNAQRSFVSLFDRDHQYILAEGINGGELDPRSGANMFGGTVIDIGRGVCPAALEFFTKADETYSSETTIANHDYCRVSDLSREPKFHDCPLRQKYSSAMRFYLAVPLRTENGMVLGSCCVLDDTPRQEVSTADIEYLQAVAKAIMEHLHLLRVNARFTRADHLIKGLGLFVEGQSSLRDWWLANTDNATKADNMTAEEKRKDLHHRANEAFGKVPRTDQNSGVPPDTSIDTSVARTSSGAGARAEADEESSLTPSSPPSSLFSSQAKGSDASAPQVGGDLHRPNIPVRALTLGSHNHEGAKTRSLRRKRSELLDAKDVGAEINQLFARASNIIREAVELEGVIFFDASADVKNVRTNANVSNDDMWQTSTSGSSEEEKATSRSKRGRSDRAVNSTQTSNPSDILGYSSRTKSSLAKNRPTASTPSLSKETLQLLLRHYPRGTVFSFDRDGVVSSSDEELQLSTLKSAELVSSFTREDGAQSRSKKRRLDANTISQVIPGAQSVAFCPIWDYNDKRWFAAFLAWSMDPNRLLDQEDLTYFMAFSSSAMTEKSRLDAIAADRTKSNFISSISHEMRSPLHGVLGNTELLRDVSSGQEQDELIDMIEVCGRTLLDTMDHLLDHAKINHLTIASKKDSRVRRQSRFHQALGQNASVDMASLVEDVVSVVYAGYVHTSSSSTLFHTAQDAKSSPLENDGIRSIAKNSIANTMVVVRIDELTKRSFVAQSGVWRRLLMNLFGNALKYTQSGYILVHLQTEDVARDSVDAPSRSRLTLSVTDTGRGIANDYLKHRMFQPFSQENDLDVGVGLGLSIVHQLAQSIGAKINVQSEANMGTNISVSAELNAATSSSTPTSRLWNKLSEVQALCTGKEVCFLGFDLLPSMSAPTGAELSSQSRQLVILKAALSKLLRSLDMTASASLLPDRASASFFFVHESYVREHMQSSDDASSSQSRPIQPWIVFCKDNSVPQHSGPTRFDVPHPFTPSNIISVILKCLQGARVPAHGNRHVDAKNLDVPLPLSAPSGTDHGLDTPEGFPRITRGAGKPEVHSLHFQQAAPFKVSETQPATGIKPKPGQYKVLIVDDNAINVKLLATFMRKMGHSYVTATDGAEAVQHYIASGPKLFDLVLMDLSMPVMDGFEATRQIRAYELKQQLVASKIIALTGLGSSEAKQAAVSSGVDLFLTKPIGFAPLKQLIQGCKEDMSST